MRAKRARAPRTRPAIAPVELQNAKNLVRRPSLMERKVFETYMWEVLVAAEAARAVTDGAGALLLMPADAVALVEIAPAVDAALRASPLPTMDAAGRVDRVEVVILRAQSRVSVLECTATSSVLPRNGAHLCVCLLAKLAESAAATSAAVPERARTSLEKNSNIQRESRKEEVGRGRQSRLTGSFTLVLESTRMHRPRPRQLAHSDGLAVPRGPLRGRASRLKLSQGHYTDGSTLVIVWGNAFWLLYSS